MAELKTGAFGAALNAERVASSRQRQQTGIRAEPSRAAAQPTPSAPRNGPSASHQQRSRGGSCRARPARFYSYSRSPLLLVAVCHREAAGSRFHLTARRLEPSGQLFGGRKTTSQPRSADILGHEVRRFPPGPECEASRGGVPELDVSRPPRTAHRAPRGDASASAGDGER